MNQPGQLLNNDTLTMAVTAQLRPLNRTAQLHHNEEYFMVPFFFLQHEMTLRYVYGEFAHTPTVQL